MYAVRLGFWYFGVAAWLVGVSDRTLASTSDGFLSAIDLIQLATASLFLVLWLFLRPQPAKE